MATLIDKLTRAPIPFGSVRQSCHGGSRVMLDASLEDKAGTVWVNVPGTDERQPYFPSVFGLEIIPE